MFGFRTGRTIHSFGGRLCLAISVLLVFVSVVLITDNVRAQEDDSLIESIDIGFSGNVVLGKWVPFTVKMSGQIAATKLQVEALDGDGIKVRIDQSSESRGRQGLIRIGRAAGITVSVLDASDQVVASRRFSLAELILTHTFLPGTTKLTLYFGLSSQEQLETLELERHLSDVSAVIDDYRRLPNHWIGYESVRTAVIVSNDLPSTALDENQIAALDRWIHLGGRALITGGKSFESFFGTDKPDGWTPGKFLETRMVDDTGSIELFAGSNDQLVKSEGPRLPVTVVEFRPDMQLAGAVDEHPLIARWMYGFGKISFIGLDFTSEPLAGWDGCRRLLTLALDDSGTVSHDATTAQTGRVSHIGFTDISGQLRAAMDQFKRVSFVTFTLVALLIGLFILAIGPGDFFFLRRMTGRMEYTWFTFSFLCLAFCVLAWFLASWLKSSDMELNQVEIIDVDTISKQVRGTLWTHIYSPGTQVYDVAMPSTNNLFGDLDEGWLMWQGLPGSGLGSMQSKSDLVLNLRQYECRIETQGSKLESIPMQNASTKTLSGTWYGSVKYDINSGLRQSANSDALLGTVTNPLDQPLYECAILYGDWVYVLQDRPLQAGETIVIEDDLREKTIAGHFTQVGGRGEDEVSSAWDPSGTRLPRIVQAMSFFDAIGGQTYTRLTNDFHSEIDFSHQLQMGRAVLIGQIRKATTPLTVNGKAFENYDKRFSLIRIVLPVLPRK